MAAATEQKAEIIAERTHKAMQTTKERRGRRENAIAAYAQMGNEASAKIRSARANRRAVELRPTITQIKEMISKNKEGKPSLREIVAEMNERRIPTPRKVGVWSAMQVQRVLTRSE